MDTFTRRFKVAQAAAAGHRALNPLEAQTLLYVVEHPDCGLGDVARYLDVAMTTMSSATDRLVRRGLVARRRPEGNRRAIALNATDAGLAEADAQKLAYAEACRAMLRALDREEQEALIRLTEKVATHDG